jgi:hypothetical protein
MNLDRYLLSFVLFIFSGCSNNPSSGGAQSGSISSSASKATKPAAIPNRGSKKSNPSSKVHAEIARAQLQVGLSNENIPLSDSAERKLASLVSAASAMPEAEAKLIHMGPLPFFVLVSKEDPSVDIDWHGDRFYTRGTHFTNKSALGLWRRLVVLTGKGYTIETFGKEASSVIEGY